MIDTTEPLSPGWWFARLIKELGERRTRYDRLDEYVRGTQPIPIRASQAVSDAYRRLMDISRTNYAELAVEALRERMIPVGFRTGASGDELGDKMAHRIWQANSLDSEFPVVLSASLALSMSYMIVGGVDPELGVPLITAEDPREVICEVDPSRRRKVLAAAKVYADDVNGVDRAYLYLPGWVMQLARKRPNPNDTSMSYTPDGWEWITEPQQLPRPVVPVVPFPNRAAMRPMSEIESHTPILDRINYTILSKLEIMTMQAFRQRAVKGDLPEHDAAGNAIDYDDVFSSTPGALWMLPATAEMWESGQLDLTPIRNAVKDDVQDFAAVTRTPLFYLTPDAANGSAEGASLAREGLVFKATDRMITAGESLEHVMSLAFLFSGDAERASLVDMETIWAPPERHTLAERADAASKAITAGVPWRTVMLDVMQFSPQQVDRMEGERVADAFAQRAIGAVPAP